MKASKRLVYIELASEVDADLCCFCRYGESMGCCDGCECKHPLDRKSGFLRVDNDIQSDCWGFRPSLEVSVITDIVGIILQNKWTSWVWWEDKEQLKIAGKVDY